VKVSVVGLGRMGRRHVQAVHSMGLEVSAICDISPDALMLTVTDVPLWVMLTAQSPLRQRTRRVGPFRRMRIVEV